ncbi:hypothetical protein PV779_17785 [Streptomyces sp. ID01-9D]|nr:hypothetical protein [Streptomyces sp. ID01-9D]
MTTRIYRRSATAMVCSGMPGRGRAAGPTGTHERRKYVFHQEHPAPMLHR